jgi:hypothetical protein
VAALSSQEKVKNNNNPASSAVCFVILSKPLLAAKDPGGPREAPQFAAQ